MSGRDPTIEQAMISIDVRHAEPFRVFVDGEVHTATWRVLIELPESMRDRLPHGGCITLESLVQFFEKAYGEHAEALAELSRTLAPLSTAV